MREGGIELGDKPRAILRSCCLNGKVYHEVAFKNVRLQNRRYPSKVLRKLDMDLILDYYENAILWTESHKVKSTAEPATPKTKAQ